MYKKFVKYTLYIGNNMQRVQTLIYQVFITSLYSVKSFELVYTSLK